MWGMYKNNFAKDSFSRLSDHTFKYYSGIQKLGSYFYACLRCVSVSKQIKYASTLRGIQSWNLFIGLIPGCTVCNDIKWCQACGVQQMCAHLRVLLQRVADTYSLKVGSDLVVKHDVPISNKQHVYFSSF